MLPQFLAPGTLWAMYPSALRAFISSLDGAEAKPLTAARERVQLRAAISSLGMEPLDGSLVAGRVGRTAVLPVMGTIRPRPSFSFFLFGGMSTNLVTLSHDLTVALKDPTIDHIVFDIDSPGGLSTGVHEYSELVFEAREKKRITAYVAGIGASAAYWIASAAHEIVIDATAMAGSIGVVSTFIDYSELDKKIGIKEIEIVSSQSPRKRLDPTTKEGRDAAQRIVDDMAAVFVAKIARNRNVSEDTVLADFGQGDVLVGERAEAAGLVDRLGSMEELLSQSSPTRAIGGGMDQLTKDQITQAYIAENHPEIATAFRAEGYKEGHEKGLSEGAEQERGRIKAIEELSIPGHSKFVADRKWDPEATEASVSQEIVRRTKAGDVDQAELAVDDIPTPLEHEEAADPNMSDLEKEIQARQEARRKAQA